MPNKLAGLSRSVRLRTRGQSGLPETVRISYVQRTLSKPDLEPVLARGILQSLKAPTSRWRLLSM